MRKMKWSRLASLFLVLVMVFALVTGCGAASDGDGMDRSVPAAETEMDESLMLIEEDEEEAFEEQEQEEQAIEGSEEETSTISEDGEYTSKDEVALYIYTYGHLPSNFITKNEAKKLGWDNRAGNLAEVAPGKSIGGDHFGNYEGILPQKKGLKYTECDIDADGGYRGAKRIIFSNQGQIYYTEDHYNTFELLYGEE
ncbi:MAG: ribonuclease [Dorea sp.]|nr:ribonuclease [Dorea sp.]